MKRDGAVKVCGTRNHLIPLLYNISRSVALNLALMRLLGCRPVLDTEPTG